MQRARITLIAMTALALSVTFVPARAATASVKLKPRFGPPTTRARVRGTGFGVSETVTISFDDQIVGTTVTDPTGSFSTRFEVPATALPGDHTVSAAGEGGLEASAPFVVRTDWTKYHFDLANSGLNPYENVLDTSNVGSLTLAWTGASEFRRDQGHEMTVANGFAYTGSLHFLYAFDAAGATGCSGVPRTCEPVWMGAVHDPSGLVRDSPTVAGGRVYVGSGDLWVFDAAGVINCSGTPLTCEPLWKGTASGIDLSSVAVSAGVAYVGTTSGALDAFDAAGVTNCSGTPTVCQPLWRGLTGGRIDSNPAVANGVVYVGSEDGSLYAFDAAGVTNCSGVPKVCEPLWTGPTGGLLASSPAVVGGLVYIGSSDGDLYAFDAAGVANCSGTPLTCEPLWKGVVGSSVGTGPAVAGGVVYVAADDTVAAFDAAGVTNCSGTPILCQPLWTGTTGVDFTLRSPVVANGVLYPGSNEDVYAFDAAGVENCTGSRTRVCQPLWTAPNLVDGSTPAVVDGRVYVAADGLIQVFVLP